MKPINNLLIFTKATAHEQFLYYKNVCKYVYKTLKAKHMDMTQSHSNIQYSLDALQYHQSRAEQYFREMRALLMFLQTPDLGSPQLSQRVHIQVTGDTNINSRNTVVRFTCNDLHYRVGYDLDLLFVPPWQVCVMTNTKKVLDVEFKTVEQVLDFLKQSIGLEALKCGIF